jgi:hypothetical protein
MRGQGTAMHYRRRRRSVGHSAAAWSAVADLRARLPCFTVEHAAVARVSWLDRCSSAVIAAIKPPPTVQPTDTGSSSRGQAQKALVGKLAQPCACRRSAAL